MDKRKDAKVKTIYNLFADENGKVETEYGSIKNFSQKLRVYEPWLLKQKWGKFNFSEEEIKQWINAGFRLND